MNRGCEKPVQPDGMSQPDGQQTRRHASCQKTDGRKFDQNNCMIKLKIKPMRSNFAPGKSAPAIRPSGHPRFRRIGACMKRLSICRLSHSPKSHTAAIFAASPQPSAPASGRSVPERLRILPKIGRTCPTTRHLRRSHRPLCRISLHLGCRMSRKLYTWTVSGTHQGCTANIRFRLVLDLIHSFPDFYLLLCQRIVGRNPALARFLLWNGGY